MVKVVFRLRSGLFSQGGQDGQCCQVGPGGQGGLRGPGDPVCQCGPGGQCGPDGPAYALNMMLYISELRMEAHTSFAAIRLILIVTQH